MRCFRLVLLCTLESVSQLIFLFIQRDGDLTAVHSEPNSSSLASGFQVVWMTRAIGRAPIARS